MKRLSKRNIVAPFEHDRVVSNGEIAQARSVVRWVLCVTGSAHRSATCQRDLTVRVLEAVGEHAQERHF